MLYFPLHLCDCQNVRQGSVSSWILSFPVPYWDRSCILVPLSWNHQTHQIRA